MSYPIAEVVALRSKVKIYEAALHRIASEFCGYAHDERAKDALIAGGYIDNRLRQTTVEGQLLTDRMLFGVSFAEVMEDGLKVRVDPCEVQLHPDGTWSRKP